MYVLKHAESRSLDDALVSLLGMSVVQRPPAANMSIHRVLQAVYRDRLGPDGRYQGFIDSARLLLEAFPKQIAGASLRNQWATCAKYIRHASALAMRYNEYKFEAQKPGDFDDFVELLTNCAW